MWSCVFGSEFWTRKDLANLDKAAKPIETEPVAKHQLNEKATQWQLRKDVPPSPSGTWNLCCFAPRRPYRRVNIPIMRGHFLFKGRLHKP